MRTKTITCRPEADFGAWLGIAALAAAVALAALTGCTARGAAEPREPHPVEDPAALERRHYCAACGREIPVRAWQAVDYVGTPQEPYHFGACALPDEEPDACDRIGD